MTWAGGEGRGAEGLERLPERGGRPNGRWAPADAGGDLPLWQTRVRCSRQRACPAAERDSEHPVDPRAHEGAGGRRPSGAD